LTSAPRGKPSRALERERDAQEAGSKMEMLGPIR